MFDWDEDFDDLVKGTGPAKPAVEYSGLKSDWAKAASAPAQAVVSAGRGISGGPGTIRAFLARWVAPALVVGALAVSVTYPDTFRAGVQSLQGPTLFAPMTGPIAHRVRAATLHAYSPRQQHTFASGLIRFSDADLLTYAAATQADLARAGSLMAPLLQDALTLTRLEIERRNLVAPESLLSVQDGAIRKPAQG